MALPIAVDLGMPAHLNVNKISKEARTLVSDTIDLPDEIVDQIAAGILTLATDQPDKLQALLDQFK